MPEVHFEVRWPDGNQGTYYSPSTAIHAHLAAGESYTLPDFVERARAAMHAASERVRAKYGYTCYSAMDTLHRLEETAGGLAHMQTGRVRILRMGHF
jgi:uncharacterized repeat protein (TIGR04042 family)